MSEQNKANNEPQQPMRKFKWDDTVEDLMRDFGMTKDDAEHTLDRMRYSDIYDQSTIDENGNEVLRPLGLTWGEMDIDEHGHVWNPPRPGWKLPEWRRKLLDELGVTPPPDPQP